jgi:serine/threonine-protein kinase
MYGYRRIMSYIWVFGAEDCHLVCKTRYLVSPDLIAQMIILVTKWRFGHSGIMLELESLMVDRLSGGADGDRGAGARLGINSRIAGYQLEELIGQGGMAYVYRAADERLGRKVAVKILAPATAADAAFRQRFLSESRAAAAVDHPNILPIYEAGEYDGVLYIAMRYVSGRDVRVLLDHGPLPALRAASVISPIASALDAAHAQGLVHRDVKPANILLDVHADRPDHVYLSDFGLSKGALPSAGLTDGQFVGTPEYVAPEQVDPAIASGRQLDGRADQYSLACTAFHLLAGVPPFQRDHYLAVIYAHTSDLPPMLTAIRGDLPQAVDAVLGRALAKSPQDRYASCTGFAEALRQVLGLPPYHVESDAMRAERSATVALTRQTDSPAQDVLDTIVAAAQVAPHATAGSTTAVDPDAADDLSSTAGHSRRSEQAASGATGSRKSRKIAALAGLAVALVAGGAVTMAVLTSAPSAKPGSRQPRRPSCRSLPCPGHCEQ